MEMQKIQNMQNNFEREEQTEKLPDAKTFSKVVVIKHWH